MKVVRFRVAATPAQVVRVLGASCAPIDNSWFASISWVDRRDSPLVGRISTDGAFYVRLPQRLGSAPRVLAMRGKVIPSDSAAHVVGCVGFRTTLRVAAVIYLALLLLSIGLVVPGLAREPRLAWIPVLFGGFAAAFLAPFWWIAHNERANLANEIEVALRRVAPVARVP